MTKSTKKATLNTTPKTIVEPVKKEIVKAIEKKVVEANKPVIELVAPLTSFIELDFKTTRDQFEGLSSYVENVGVNVAFHAIIKGNTELLKLRDRNTIRQLGDIAKLLPVVWNKESEKYEYNLTRAKSLCTDYEFNFAKDTFQEFALKMVNALEVLRNKKALLLASNKKEKVVEDAKPKSEKIKTSVDNLCKKYSKSEVLNAFSLTELKAHIQQVELSLIEASKNAA
jgi:hypothetical protein